MANQNKKLDDSSYIKRYSDSLKKELMSVSFKKAKKFLFKNGYLCSAFEMPEYYKPSGLDSISLDSIDFSKSDSLKITNTLNVVTPKNKLSWRHFNFIHPYIFIHMVNEITSESNWNKIKKLICNDNLVHSYSVPCLALREQETQKGRAILNWIQMTEKDAIKDSTNFNYLTVTDIKNFYPSIYTHSIAWAIHSKKIMKIFKNRRNPDLLGYRLDKLFQNSKDGQTNGVPVSSMVSDIIAEIILTDVDKKLSIKIKSEKIQKDILIARFRDDYRIFSKKPEQGRLVLKLLSKVLFDEYNLYINSEKSQSFDDIIEGSYRPWNLEVKRSSILRKIEKKDFSECNDSNDLKDCLIDIYTIQKKYPISRVSISVLTKISENLFDDKKIFKLYQNDIPEIISILRKLSIVREDVTPQVFILLDIILRYIKTKKERVKVLENIQSVITGKDDQEYQLIWFYRLCLSHAPELCGEILKNNNLPLLRVVNNKYYKYSVGMFQSIDNLSMNDEKELRKFNFVDMLKLKNTKGKKINPVFLNPFRY